MQRCLLSVALTAASAQWDSIEDKTSVVVYGGGALTLLWLSSTLVGAINNVPVVRSPQPRCYAARRREPREQAHTARHSATPCVQVPKLMELVGLAYTAWFVYRYLLFKARVCARQHSPRFDPHV